MSFGVAELATPFFSQHENGGGTPGTLDVRVRAPMVKVGHYRRAGAETPLSGVTGNWAPVNGETQDVSDDGILKIGDIIVFTVGPNARLEVPDEPSQNPGAIIVADAERYQLFARQHWPYGNGYRYVGRLMRRQRGV